MIIVAPRRATVSGISLRAIVCEARLLRWGVKSDVANVDARSQWHGKRLNGPIEVLVVNRVLIVPHSGGRVAHFITHEPNPIVAVIGFDLIHRCPSPGSNGWLLTRGAAHRTKTKRLINPSYRVLLVRSVVIHVALIRMTLAPGAFVRHDVLSFGEVCCPRV